MRFNRTLSSGNKAGARRKEQFLSCLQNCACRCHSHKKYRSLHALAKYPDTASMSRSDRPWLFSDFDEQRCHQSEGTKALMRYSLRRWFTSTMTSLNVDLILSKFRIQLIVESLRIIPYNPPILKSVERGDLSQIQTLMTTRNFSICNRDSDGFVFLYQATHYCLRASDPLVAMNMCKALLDMGVNGGQKDEIGKTPCDTLIDQILVASALQCADTCGFENDQICDVAVLFKPVPIKLSMNIKRRDNSLLYLRTQCAIWH